LFLAAVAVLSLPPALGGYGLLEPRSDVTFVDLFQDKSAQTNHTVYVGEIGIEVRAHGPLSAGIPLNVNITVMFNESALALAGYTGALATPSFVSVVLDGARLNFSPQKDPYGNPTWAWISLTKISDSKGIQLWRNQSVTVTYYNSGSWGHTVYFGPSPCQYYCSLYFPTDDTAYALNEGSAYGVVIEPYSVYVADETNSLIVSFTMFIIVLALLDLRVGHRV
jgi:hypothetical protein